MRRILGRNAEIAKKQISGVDRLRYKPIKTADSVVGPRYGAALLCQEHNYNRLTPNLIADGLYHLDVAGGRFGSHVVVLTSEFSKQSVCSVDYALMAEMLKKGDRVGPKAIIDYLTDSYKFVIHLAKMSKPLYYVGAGVMESLGGTAMAVSGMPVVYESATLSFPEASQYGFVPLGGSTYFLSRLPNEFGTFLALTGATLRADEIIHCGFADKMIGDEVKHEDIIEKMRGAPRYMPTIKPLTAYMGTENNREETEFFLRKQRHEENIVFARKLGGTSDMHKGVITRSDPWALIERRATELLRADQDNDARVMMRMRDNADRMTNYYAQSMDAIRAVMPGVRRVGFSYAADIPVIRRCFYPNTLAEIMELLRKDHTEFAAECLRTMEAASPLALGLTLKILREARKRNFVECAVQELSAAANRVSDKEFPIALEQKLSPSLSQGTHWIYNLKDVNEDLIQKYAENPGWVSGRAIGIVENALLPIKQFSQYFPDSLRIWLNTEDESNSAAYQDFSVNLVTDLQCLGVDIRSSLATAKVLRAELNRVFIEQQFERERLQRAEELVGDPRLLERYLGSRKELIDQFCDGPEYYKKINQRIQQIFEKAFPPCLYSDKMGLMSDASNNAHKILKHRFYLRLKHFLFEHRVLQSPSEYHEITKKHMALLKPGTPHVSSSNEFNDADRSNPKIKSTFAFHLAQALRKEKQLPSKIATYLAYPQKPEAVTRWLFDVPALESLKKRVQTDQWFLQRLKNFYSVDTTHGTEEMLIFFSYYDFQNGGPFPEDKIPDYESYLQIKKKAKELVENMKEVLTKELDEYIDLGNRQAAEKLKRKRSFEAQRKSLPAKAATKEERKQVAVPKTAGEFVTNYLQNNRDMVPFWIGGDPNPYIKKTSETVQWLLEKVVDADSKRKDGIRFPSDLDLTDPLDQYVINKVGGRALIGPMEDRVLPTFEYFAAPLINNQMASLQSFYRDLREAIYDFKGAAPHSEERRVLTNRVLKLVKEAAASCSAALAARSWSLDKEAEDEDTTIPEQDEVLTMLVDSSSISKDELAAVAKAYKDVSEYLVYLTGAMKFIQDRFHLQPRLLDEVTDNINTAAIEKVQSENITRALAAFKTAWNHYYSEYQPTRKAVANANKVAEIHQALSQLGLSPVVSFIDLALKYPSMTNIDALYAELNNKESAQPLSPWKYVNVARLLKMLSQKITNVRDTTLDYESIEKRNTFEPHLVVRTLMTSRFANDPEFLKLVNTFLDLVGMQQVNLNQEKRSKVKLRDLASGAGERIDARTVDKVLDALSAPDLPAVEETPHELEGDELVQFILRPTSQIEKMARHYGNRLEMELLANWNSGKVKRIISDYAANRVKYVRLHPLFGKVEGNEELRNKLCTELEKVLKSELNLLGEQAAPFGIDLVTKYILPERIHEFSEEDERYENLKVANWSEYMRRATRAYKYVELDYKYKHKRIVNSALGKMAANAGKNPFVPVLKDGKPVYEKDDKTFKNAPGGNLTETLAAWKHHVESKEPLRRERDEGDEWDPARDAPIVPEDRMDLLLKEYFTEREKAVDVAKSLQKSVVSMLDPRQTDPVKGFSRLAAIRKNRQDDRYLYDYNMNLFKELDRITQNALYGNDFVLSPLMKDGFMGLKRHDLNSLPDAFPHHDMRYPPQQWFEDAMMRCLGGIFSARFSVERSMTYNQLRAFDRQALRLLEREHIREILLRELHREEATLVRDVSLSRKEEETKGSREVEGTYMDTDRKQQEIINMVKNKDVLLRRMAYEAAQWKKAEEEASPETAKFDKKYGDLLTLEAIKGVKFSLR